MSDKALEKGPFKPGNQLWRRRNLLGHPRAFETPEDLWNAAVEYFQWIEDNPLKEEKVFHSAGVIKKATISKMHAMTIGGLCLHLDIDQETFRDYRNRDAYSRIAQKIVDIIREQKFAGASADLLNANIIARDLGLVDKNELSGPNGGPIAQKWTVEIKDAT